MNILYRLISVVSLSAVALFGATHNEVDNPDKFKKEKGHNFYEDSNSSSVVSALANKVSKSNGDIIKLLKDILKENKEQTKTQKEILSVLDDFLGNKPKYMTLPDGTKCLENSSAKCYKTPMIPEAKKIPALSSFMQDPTNINKAANYLQWQARHFTYATDFGNAIAFAAAQFGTKAYPMSYRNDTHDTFTGGFSRLRKSHNINIINQQSKKIEIFIFIGKSVESDVISFSQIGDYVRKLKDIDFTIVFIDNKNKKLFDDATVLLEPLQKTKSQIKKIVSSKMFDKYGIYTTPAIVVKYIDKDKQKKAQTISVGKRSSKNLISRTIRFLEFKKLIKKEHAVGYKVWKEEANSAKQTWKSNYGIDLNQTRIDEIKQGQ